MDCQSYDGSMASASVCQDGSTCYHNKATVDIVNVKTLLNKFCLTHVVGRPVLLGWVLGEMLSYFEYLGFFF